MSQQAASESSFGEKLFDAACKAVITPQQVPTDVVAEIWSLGVLIKPASGNTIFIAYTETSKLDASNYKVSITASNGLSIVLNQFGIKYDHFSKQLTDSYGDALAKALLMEEAVLVYEAPCYFARQESQISQLAASSPCRARIYETALVILPSSSSLPSRLPFSQIQSANLENYRVKITTRDGALVEFSRLANATQFFFQKLQEAMKSLEASTVETVKQLVPSATFDELQKLSLLMAEGRAAARNDVDQISPGLWAKLEKTVDQSELADTYRYIASKGRPEMSCVGLRKSGDGVYVWFMIPVMGSVNDGGNAVTMEVTSESGHATYLFRVMSRAEFPNATNDSFGKAAEEVLHDLNEATIATGFRREPIYLTNEELNTPDYSKYLYAAEHLEPLKFLRERYLGRVIHNNFEQWKADLNEALLFNVTTKDDEQRWSKRETEPPQEQPTIELSPPVPKETLSAAVMAQQIVAGPIPTVQTLSASRETGGNMAERILTLIRMDSDDDGNVKLCLHDNDHNQDVWMTLSGDEAMKLGAFPGSKVKVTLQKS